ncbi:putative MFS family arabinose efflux permease [Rhodococcus wratislaviensis]|uniref:Mfs transporter n=1 Tax=Rhodococcus wratislaviensis TaxID=44752 RepID=A0AB38FCX9_RHOWR|nr:MFS transporter [Rhodococcus wratislaviensis]REE75494.1 putative MFS family arabinose efflux permease [Rhodococcus wratislaviensis]SPZ39471.1 mfs transporter [Rhodococcus wratislaviensis]
MGVREATRVGTTFVSMRNRNYRLYFVGQLASQAGNWMQTVAQSFLVLELTDSSTQLGLTVAARYLPIFLIGPWGGLAADRFDKRVILAATQSAASVLALIFALLVITHSTPLWAIYVLATALGLVNVIDVPARQSFISELVRPDELGNAVTLNSITINAARLFGAALGGLVASVLGLAVCFCLNSVSYLVVLVTLFWMDRSQITASRRAPRERGQIRSGFRYVRETRELLVPLIMVAAVGALAWEFQVTLPLVAKETFGGGAGLYGTMMAVMSAGAVVGGLVTASRPTDRARSLAVAAAGWGVALTAAALAPNLAVEFAALLFVGYGSITFNALGRTALQLGARADMRGRVMALWMTAWAGTTPIGGPVVGWIGEAAGARFSLLAGGVPTIAVGLLCYPALARIDARRSGSIDSDRHPRLNLSLRRRSEE